MVGHLALCEAGWVLGEQLGERLTEVSIGEAVRQEPEEQQSAQERLHGQVGETKAGGALRLLDAWTLQALESLFADRAIVACFLDVE